MTPIELIRKIIPTRLRIRAYVTVIALVGWSRLLLRIYLFLLHGHSINDVTIEDGKPTYHYKGTKIDSPKDSIEAYVEVFWENVYDRITPKQGDTVIDIGAYVGMYSIKASQFVGDTGLVIAVEPMSSNLIYLRKNTGSLSNVKVANVALSSYCGIGKLYTSPSSAAHSMTYVRRGFEEVSVLTLDALVRLLGIPKVDYIKMDAEGSDMDILEGAEKALRDYSPVLSIASYHTDMEGVPYIGKVTTFLTDLGYECVAEKGYICAQKRKENL